MHDVVVIGAGSAGAVVAARATENPALSVCLLEAGPDYPTPSATPWDLVNSHDNSYSDHDWGFSYTAVASGRATPFPRGRVTGGSSAVNTTIALRGVPEDYDHWAALGNDEWAWERVLPAFRRLERDLDFGDRPYHGDAGPISIRRYPIEEMTPPQAAFLEAAEELGYPYCEDHNDPAAWGYGPHPMNKLGRLRISTAIGYLAPARARPNLVIRPDSAVARLVVEGGRVRRADLTDGTSVEGRLFVLCSGSISSPLVLLRSGLGPRDELEAHGIDVAADVPGVGRNLADHPAAMVVCEARDPSIIDLDSPIIQTILRYTAPGSPHRNDLQIEAFSFARRPPDRPPAFGIAGVLEWATSRGTVRLSSADPAAPPIVDSNMCSEEDDVDRLAQCLLDTVAFAEAGPIAALTSAIPYPRVPADLDAARDLVRQRSGSGFHPCGTVRMGPDDDPMAVVDQYGRLRGADNLVVADASIMPTVPRANTNLSSIMIGEMVGEWVRTRPTLYGL